MHTLSKNPLRIALAAAVFALGAVSAFAQTVKVGVVNTYSGPTATLGEYIDKGKLKKCLSTT